MAVYLEGPTKEVVRLQQPQGWGLASLIPMLFKLSVGVATAAMKQLQGMLAWVVADSIESPYHSHGGGKTVGGTDT